MIARLQGFASLLASIEIWIVGLVVAASFLSTRLLLPAVIVSCFFWLVRWAASRRVSLRTPADWGILTLLFMLPVTVWATAYPTTTMPQVYRLLTGVALYYAMVNWTTTQTRLHWLYVGIIGAGLILALSGLVSVTWSTEKFSALFTPIYSHLTVLASDPVNPNVMAGSLVILLPFSLSWLLFGWESMRWKYRLALGVASLITMIILGMTLSRGAWIAFAVVLIILALLRWRRSWIIIAVGALAGAGVVAWLGVIPVLSLLFSNSSLGSLDVRIEVWQRALYMIHDFPFTGIGMGNFSAVTDAVYPIFMATPGSIPHAHNLFLQVAVDLGIPGLVAWLGIFLIIGFVSWKIFRRGKFLGDVFLMGLGAALLCSQAALAVHGLTDAVTWGMVRSAPIVWVIWGLAAACWNFTGGIPESSSQVVD